MLLVKIVRSYFGARDALQIPIIHVVDMSTD
jgi:hypothetical protein